uniref:Chemokine interleukin-8-like domain-containing protein n=1 Tax=Astyanax mexicanus TaxID=7994 RepID=A0A3B1JSG6_ASTMX
MFLIFTAPAAAPVHDCCFNLTEMKIPLRIVESHTETHSDCPFKAFVLLSKSGKMFCGDPDAEWVKSLVAALDQRNTPTTAKPLTTNSPTLSTAKLFREGQPY